MPPTPREPDDSDEGYTFSYSPEADDQPTVAIVEAISWLKEVPVRELEPLHSAIDTDELTTFFGEPTDQRVRYRSSGPNSRENPSVTFPYEGYRITVTPEEIHIDPE